MAVAENNNPSRLRRRDRLTHRRRIRRMTVGQMQQESAPLIISLICEELLCCVLRRLRSRRRFFDRVDLTNLLAEVVRPIFVGADPGLQELPERWSFGDLCKSVEQAVVYRAGLQARGLKDHRRRTMGQWDDFPLPLPPPRRRAVSFGALQDDDAAGYDPEAKRPSPLDLLASEEWLSRLLQADHLMSRYVKFKLEAPQERDKALARALRVSPARISQIKARCREHINALTSKWRRRK